MAKKIQSRKAAQGERTLEVTIRFWTNNIPTPKPKHAWPGGTVEMKRNETHGIKPKAPRHFNSPMDLPGVIERVLVDHGVVLHLNKRMRRYWVG
jgi:hypothetical protein